MRAPTLAPALLLLILLLGAVVGAVIKSSEALRLRQIEAAAIELELATHTIFMVERIPDHENQGIEEEHEAAVELLEGSFDEGAAALKPSERAAAAELRNELVGEQHVSSTPSPATEPLMDSFRLSSARASTYAADAERQSFQLVALACVAGVGAALMLLRSGRRERRLIESLEDQAMTDQLTGLPNRRALADQLEAARVEMGQAESVTGLLYVDLDGFKAVNDTLGHDAGDEILRLASQRLGEASGPGETVARVGGDEFVVLLSGLGGHDEAVAAAERYLAIFEEPSELQGEVEFVRASIGVASTNDPAEVGNLTSGADLAMYEAKRSARGSIVSFEEPMRDQAERSSELLRALRTADLDAEFHLAYQSVVSVEDQEVQFFEALLRWESPVLGSVRPDQFIPVAEATGEVRALGRWVIANAVQQLARWDSDPEMRGVRVSCNVSALELTEVDFVENVVAVLRASNVMPDRLIIEVTESVALDESGLCVDALGKLRAAGLGIAIDDFGAGYANFGHLFKVPFDVLKIDRDLLLRLTSSLASAEGAESPREILASINDIATHLNAEVVCEGVETEEQRSLLASAGVSYMQGWLVDRPARAEQVQRPGSASTEQPQSTLSDHLATAPDDPGSLTELTNP